MSALAAIRPHASIRVLRLGEAAEWTALVDSMPAKDLTHYPRFAAVYQDKGDGIAECFVYENRHGRVIYPYLLRPLAQLPFVPESLAQRHDIITPYCYGGPIRDASASNAPGLWKAFRAAFDSYACWRGVVSEFIRFHPHLQNNDNSQPGLDALLMHRDNIVIDLTAPAAELFSQCRETHRRYIRRAHEAGLQLEQLAPAEWASRFAALYQATMARHNQTGYLNLPPTFFEILFRRLGSEAKLFGVMAGDRIAAAAIFLPFGSYLDYFLGASDVKLLSLYPNHLLFHEVSVKARRLGFKTLHLGGGRDSLVFFKSGFSRQRRPFYICHRVHDGQAYQLLTAARSTWPHLGPSQPGFFPAYRAGLE